MRRLQSLYRRHSSPLHTAELLTPHQILSASLKPPLVETKHRVAKSSQTFRLQNWETDPQTGTCVGRWVNQEPTLQYNSPAGSYSWGVWQSQGPLKNIGAYRIHDNHGNLLTYRLDILKDVIISDSTTAPSAVDRIQFLDLVVDCWLWPPEIRAVGSEDILIEDIDELHCLREGGDVDQVDCELINDTLWKVLEDPGQVVAAIDRAIDLAKGSVTR